jgi:hypothetical protein
MTVEPDANLRGNVGQQERLIHGFLRRLGICSGDHVSTVVPAPEVILQFGTERRRDTFVLYKTALRPVARVRALGTRILAQNRLGEMLCCLFSKVMKRVCDRVA